MEGQDPRVGNPAYGEGATDRAVAEHDDARRSNLVPWLAIAARGAAGVAIALGLGLVFLMLLERVGS